MVNRRPRSPIVFPCVFPNAHQVRRNYHCHQTSLVYPPVRRFYSDVHGVLQTFTLMDDNPAGPGPGVGGANASELSPGVFQVVRVNCGPATVSSPSGTWFVLDRWRSYSGRKRAPCALIHTPSVVPEVPSVAHIQSGQDVHTEIPEVRGRREQGIAPLLKLG